MRDGSALRVDLNDQTASVLARYFRSCNTGSFIRQLYNYGFKRVGRGAVAVFRHDAFTRDAFHRLVAIKQSTVARTELEELNAALKMMTSNCEQMDAMEKRLYAQVSETIKRNQESMHEVLAIQREFASRIWSVAVFCAVLIVSRSSSLHAKWEELLRRHASFGSADIAMKQGEDGVFTLNWQALGWFGQFVNSNSGQEFNVGLLTAATDELNALYFCLPSNRFHRNVLGMLQSGQSPPCLVTHTNFGMLAEVVQLSLIIVEAAGGGIRCPVCARKSFPQQTTACRVLAVERSYKLRRTTNPSRKVITQLRLASCCAAYDNARIETSPQISLK